MTEEMRTQLPPTDTRFRPDIRQYEQGKFRGADFEKARLISQGYKVLKE